MFNFASSCKQFGPVSTCECSKYIIFCFLNLKILEKIKADVDRLLLVLIVKKKFPIYFAEIYLFSISKPKVAYLRPFLSSLPFHKFRKENSLFIKWRNFNYQLRLITAIRHCKYIKGLNDSFRSEVETLAKINSRFNMSERTNLFI